MFINFHKTEINCSILDNSLVENLLLNDVIFRSIYISLFDIFRQYVEVI